MADLYHSIAQTMDRVHLAVRDWYGAPTEEHKVRMDSVLREVAIVTLERAQVGSDQTTRRTELQAQIATMLGITGEQLQHMFEDLY